MKNKSAIIVVSVVILVNIILSIAGWIIYGRIYTTEKSRISDHLSNYLEERKHHLSDWLVKINTEMRIINENRNDDILAGYLTDFENIDSTDRWLKSIKEKYSADSISLVNDNNESPASGGVQENSGFAYLKNTGYGISNPFILDGKLLLDLRINIDLDDGKKEIKGFLNLRIDLGSKVLENQDKISNGYNSISAYFLWKGNGESISNFNLTNAVGNLFCLTGNQTFEEKRKMALLFTTEGGNETVKINNMKILTCVKSIKGNNWFLLACVDVDEITAGVKLLFYKIIPILLLIDFVFVGSLFVSMKFKRKYFSNELKNGIENRTGDIGTEKGNYSYTFKGKELDLETENIGNHLNDGFADNAELKLNKINSPVYNKSEIKKEIKGIVPKSKNKILSSLDQVKKLGYIPKILFEVNQLLKKEPENSAKLSALISKDLALTSKMLSVANSPLYGLQRKVTSIEYTIVLLGIKEVNRLVTAISLSDAVRFPSSNKVKYLDYWKHSMVVGNSARDIAFKLGFPDLASDVFLAGIFHDLGIPILAKYFPADYDLIMNQIKEGKNCLDAEMEVLGLTHQEVGAYAARRWDLPEIIVNIIENHHNPMHFENNKTICGLVNLADWMTYGINPENSYWDTGSELENSIDELLGFKSIENREKFIDNYKPILQEAFRWVKL